MLVNDRGIWYRQSWLDTYMRCAERGRFAITKPEMDAKSGDSATLGTGVHAGAEVIILGGSVADARAALEKAILEEFNDPGIIFKQYSNIDEVIIVSHACFDAWLEELWPWLVAEGLHEGEPEQEFEVELFRLEDGTPVGIRGTADKPAKKNTIIDWKSSGRAYKQWEKQRFAIQPSTYGTAGVRGAFAPFTYEWPVTFVYGVAIRPSKVGGKATTQLVPVRRTESHARWMLKQIRTALWLAQTDLGTSWPTTETDWLCSEKWCPWWSLCRGAVLSPFDDQKIELPSLRAA